MRSVRPRSGADSWLGRRRHGARVETSDTTCANEIVGCAAGCYGYSQLVSGRALLLCVYANRAPAICIDRGTWSRMDKTRPIKVDCAPGKNDRQMFAPIRWEGAGASGHKNMAHKTHCSPEIRHQQQRRNEMFCALLRAIMRRYAHFRTCDKRFN